MSDFLTRWSRRKRAAEAEVAEAPVAVAVPVQEVGEPAAPQPERTPLPDLADISADTDIRGFLAPDVAPELKRRRCAAPGPPIPPCVISSVLPATMPMTGIHPAVCRASGL